MRKATRVALALVLGLSPWAADAAERIEVPELPGWKVVANVRDRAGESTDLIPSGESNDTWSRRVTIQAFRGSPMTVPEFLDQVLTRTAQVCDGAAAGPPSLGKVSGVQAGTRTIACGRYKGDGRGTFALHYVIRGREAFYAVTRLWRGVPFDPSVTPLSAAELREWTDYVGAIELCDTTGFGRACQ
jgi:hypothetical protein